jgi:hypothetical protein
MASENKGNKRDEKTVNRLNELPAFVVKDNPRITEAEQLRLVKRSRIFFKEAMVKIRGKQWDLAAQDMDETRKICKVLGWQEGILYLDSMREVIASKKTSDVLETHSRIAQERYNKTRTARTQRVNAEHDRLDKMHQASQDRMLKLRSLIETSKTVDISRLAGILELDDVSVKNEVPEWVRQFGFKTKADKIIFNDGKITDFIDALDKQFSH